VALLLDKYGIQRVRPLVGGLQGWIDRGYPLAMLPTEDSTSVAA
jgi:3-mercaptopyruvate sulfurtransferase SseA